MAQQHTRHPWSVWIDSHYSKLERDYPNEWIAADATGIIAHGPTCDSVIKSIEETGKKVSDTAIAFIRSGVFL